jgi:hypothetical protein
MNRAQIRQRRTDHTGRQLVNVVCPVCDRRHWMPDDDTGCCTRKPGTFTITTTQRRTA